MKKSKLIKIKEIIYRSIVTFLIAFLSIGLVHTQPVFAATQTLGGRTVEGDLLIRDMWQQHLSHGRIKFLQVAPKVHASSLVLIVMDLVIIVVIHHQHLKVIQKVEIQSRLVGMQVL